MCYICSKQVMLFSVNSDHAALPLIIKNKLEGMVIKWCHQIDDVLTAKSINMGINPTPSFE